MELPIASLTSPDTHLVRTSALIREPRCERSGGGGGVGWGGGGLQVYSREESGGWRK